MNVSSCIIIAPEMGEGAQMRLPDSILEVLQDGEPHHARELAKRTKLTLKELDRVMNFLVKYGFAAKLGENVRIESQFGSLLRKL